MFVEEKNGKKHLKGKEWLNDVKCQVARWYAHTIICKESLPLRIWDNSSSNAVSPLTVWCDMHWVHEDQEVAL